MSNGQAKSINKKTMNNLKKRLETANGIWVMELLGVLWAYRMTPRIIIGESQFSLVYGTEIIIPIEI